MKCLTKYISSKKQKTNKQYQDMIMNSPQCLRLFDPCVIQYQHLVFNELIINPGNWENQNPTEQCINRTRIKKRRIKN